MSARKMTEREWTEFIDGLCEMDPTFAQNYKALVTRAFVTTEMRTNLVQWLIRSAKARARRTTRRWE